MQRISANLTKPAFQTIDIAIRAIPNAILALKSVCSIHTSLTIVCTIRTNQAPRITLLKNRKSSGFIDEVAEISRADSLGICVGGERLRGTEKARVGVVGGAVETPLVASLTKFTVSV